MGIENPIRRRRVEPNQPIPKHNPAPAAPPVKEPAPAEPAKVPA